MGSKSSRTAPETSAQDNHSAWGSDIDESFCGPGKICADEWTPLPSGRTTPYDFEEEYEHENEHVITEQPRIFTMTPIAETLLSEGIEDDLKSSYDLMTIHEPVELNAPVVIMPPEARKRKRKEKNKSKLKLARKRGWKRKPSTETPILYSQRKTPSHKHPRKKLHVIRVRRMRIRNDPRYPIIAPPGMRPDLKFKKQHPDEMRGRFIKAVPPRHLKGIAMDPKPHFRYRGVTKIIG